MLSIHCAKHLVANLITATVVAVTVAPVVFAEPSYPDTGSYRSAGSLEKFKVTDKDGVWFTTPLGLYCGIDDDGGYGCSGSLPGVPPDVNEIGWFPGDPAPRLYHAAQPRFSSGTRQTILPGLTVLAYRGSSCAVTKESWVYCVNGDNPASRIMLTTGATYRGAAPEPAAPV